MTSVVIAAHNEASVIERCLRAIADGNDTARFDVTVVANGCTDDTAERAARFPWVRVLDVATPGKANALNEGDRVAVGFPRIYLDADMVVSGADLRLLCQRLNELPVEAVVPARKLDLAGRPLLVRAYYAIQSRLPVYNDGLFGRGAIVLSEAGRQRFGIFPEIVADDLFLDSQFASSEKAQVRQVTSVVSTPLHTADLINRLTRVRRGNADLRASSAGVRPANRLSWLRDVVLPRPWLAPAAVIYVGITLYAARAARRSSGEPAAWLRDESSRSAA